MRGLAIAIIVTGVVSIGGIIASCWPSLPITAVLAILYTVGIIAAVPVMWGDRRD